MAYYTGTANTLHDLRATVVATLLNHGWSEDGNVVYKGGLPFTLTVSGDGISVSSTLNLVVGTGRAGSSLVGGYGSPLRIGPLNRGANLTSWEWPVQYHLHVLSELDEVYLMVNYGTYWQAMSLGSSPSPGCPGTGNWGHASLPATGVISPTGGNLVEAGADIRPDGCFLDYYYGARFNSAAPFFQAQSGASDAQNSSCFHGVVGPDGSPQWNSRMHGLTSSDILGVSSATPLVPLMGTQPNSWNSEVSLLPCQVFQRRAENKASLVGELAHLRFLRNDYLPDGEVITIGLDQWKVYPMYRRNTAARNGGRGDHSGTQAIAIRYDGP